MNERISRRDFLECTKVALTGSIINNSELLKVRYVDYFDKGDSNYNKIALTIDDGWYPDKVDKTIDLLNKLEVDSNFFPVGRVIRTYPEVFIKAIDSGVELYNHTENHIDLGKSESESKKDLYAWEKSYETLGVGKYKNRILRPPGNRGVSNPNLINAASSLGYIGIAGWSAWSDGYRSGYTKERVISEIKDQIKPGVMILMHFVDSDIEAIPDIVKIARGRGLEFVPLTKLPGTPIFDGDYGVESDTKEYLKTSTYNKK